MSVGIKTGLSAFVTTLLLFLIRDRLHFDPATYSAHLADNNTHLGIANFWNVITNVGFAYLGIYGLLHRKKFPESYRTLGTIFALAILGTGFGSSYFHYNPNPSTLFWDQLPMSIGFASFVGMVIADRVSVKAGRILGYVLSVVGPWSVWNIYFGNGDTLFYICLQFGTLLFALLVITLTRAEKMKTSLIFFGLIAYIVAKVLETYDGPIFDTLGFISGHSLKHIAATVALWAIFKGTVEKNT
jgi:hypothetical protein